MGVIREEEEHDSKEEERETESYIKGELPSYYPSSYYSPSPSHSSKGTL